MTIPKQTKAARSSGKSTGAQARAAPEAANHLADLPDPYMSQDEAERWRALKNELIREIGPKTIIETFIVDDIACLLWEITKLRRTLADILHLDRPRSIGNIVHQLSFETPDGDPFEADAELAMRWAAGMRGAEAEGAAFLAARGLQITAVRSASLEHKLGAVERVEALIAAKESRINRQHQEIDRMRAVASVYARDVTLRREAASDVDDEA